ncbi:hypothetical protein [Pedobacter gandavensis]|uniref:Uncharacterized protein n=1 Tax=Pedobacter gandavensis TaxID=2679963 RepID=A0ABR6EV04_9SPHI|nr:hypothetical protein [Pedobacter gandavensis]MBB2148801.1 hypothetical protein [Pedobacter gandavensis]
MIVDLKIKVETPEQAAHIIMVMDEMSNAIFNHPVWPKCNVKRAAIVSEESGELIREANLLDEGKGSLAGLKTECIQTAAMCFRMLNAISHDEKELKNMFGEFTGEV